MSLCLKLKLVAKTVGYRLQYVNGLFGDFRTNAVAGENGKFQEHGDFDLVIGRFRNWVIEIV